MSETLPIDDILYYYDESYDATIDEDSRAKIYAAIEAINRNPKNPIKQKKIISDAFMIVLHSLTMMESGYNELRKMFVNTMKSLGKNNGSKWTKDDDETLIEFVAGGTPIPMVAAFFGRTPSAIASRVTKLVGIGRLSQQVAGRFIGEIDGIYTSAEISGDLYKNVS